MDFEGYRPTSPKFQKPIGKKFLFAFELAKKEAFEDIVIPTEPVTLGMRDAIDSRLHEASDRAYRYDDEVYNVLNFEGYRPPNNIGFKITNPDMNAESKPAPPPRPSLKFIPNYNNQDMMWETGRGAEMGGIMQPEYK